jgi:hypothetical protein
MTYMQLLGGESGPLCPYMIQVVPPADPRGQAHRRATALVNKVYDEFHDRRDADGEMSAEDEKLYDERVLASPYDIDRMSLFHESATPAEHMRTGDWVEAWWFQCRCCGFVLPAARQSRSPR